MAWILEHESLLRLSVFLGLLALMLAWEVAAPARRFEVPRLTRWGSNLGLVLIDTGLLRFAVPLLAVGVAAKGWGLMNWLDVPIWIAGIVGFVALELLVYWQHRLFHEVPFLWRFHRVHHCDTGFDATTGFRFHPAEAVISMFSKMALVAALGIPVVAVVIFEIILSGAAIFNHGNVRLYRWLEPWARRLIVTPDHHRIHHSSVETETNSNYAFSISLWDHVFGTYQQAPTGGQEGMKIGLETLREEEDQRLDRLLLQPLKKP